MFPRLIWASINLSDTSENYITQILIHNNKAISFLHLCRENNFL